MQGEKVIIVAAHKRYTMPADSLYLPLQVGAEGKSDIGYRKDNEGENISEKNPYYCELTGLYWAWKNLECEYLGLAHYRRHFKGKSCLFLPKFKKILTAASVSARASRNRASGNGKRNKRILFRIFAVLGRRDEKKIWTPFQYVYNEKKSCGQVLRMAIRYFGKSRRKNRHI